MTESVSSTMESTTINSRSVRNLPVITFVGRPLDSAKSFSVFLAALRIVLQFSDLPNFHIWIVGGDEEACCNIQTAIEKIPDLSDLQRRGLILLFGKVAYDALPEFYSRSTLVVLPSRFETFGRVAVEAMACGCPVIAANTTSIKETVLHGMTGLLYPASDITSLAAILVDCLITPRRAKAWGNLSRQWTSNVFTLEHQFAAYGQLYQGKDKVSPGYMTFDTPVRRFQEVISNEFTDSIETVITHPTELLSWEDHPCHLAAHVQSGEDCYLAMRYQTLGEGATVLHPLPPTCSYTRSPAQRLTKVRRLLTCVAVAATMPHDMKSGIVLYPEELYDRFWDAGEQYLLLKSTGEKHLPAQARERLQEALEAFFASPCPQTMNAADMVANGLDAQLEDAPGVFRMRHPQLEMYRLGRYLDAREPLLDAGFVSMARCLLDLLTVHDVLMPKTIMLQRFDGGGSQYTGHLSLLLVLDECGFAAGPLNWAQHQAWRLEQGENIQSVMREPVPGHGDEVPMGLIWVAVVLIHNGLSANAEGCTQVPIRLNAVMEQFVQMLTAGDLSLQNQG